MIIPKKLVSAVLFILLAIPLCAERPKNRRETVLRDGDSSRGSVVVDFELGSYNTYKIIVPENAYGIIVRLEDSSEDLDLFALFDQPISDYQYVDAFSETDSGEEFLLLTRLTDPPLKTGVYFVDVTYRVPSPPVINSKPVKKVTYTIKYDIIDYPITEVLAGERKEFTLKPEKGMIERFKVEVPSKVSAMRVDILQSTGDIDFLIGRDKPLLTKENCDYIKSSYLAREHLLIPGEELNPGTYYLTLIEQMTTPYDVNGTVLVSFEELPPEEIISPFPEIGQMSPQERAVAATVEIISGLSRGSGCLISPDGYILTNYHVIEKMDGKPNTQVWVALNGSPYEPPEELFIAELIDHRKSSDLALLKIDGTFYGQNLPAGIKFPYYRLGDDRALGLGDSLKVIGFPGIGGTGTRVTISLTTGIVSGFEKRGDGFLIKTDSMINYGNSGGAAVNGDFELIGLPTIIIGEGSGQMGFIYPLNLVPDEWLKPALSGR